MKDGYTIEEFGGIFERSMKKHLGLKRLEKVKDEKSPVKNKKREATPDELLKRPDAGSCDEVAPLRALFTQNEKKLTWKCEDSFPLEAHGFIRDWQLGTIGIVHFLEDEKSEDIRTLLENAAYVRHLLQEYRTRDSAPIAVEVTLVMLKWSETSSRISKALRSITETSTFLHTIGVSLLKAEHHGSLQALRRAFPWLLTATKEWFSKIGGTSEKRCLETLEVENFRVDGTRKWSLDQGEQIHLVHGPNGSGKSSLVESLEYLLCGRVERLESEWQQGNLEAGSRRDHYRSILTHRSQDGSSRVLSMKAKYLGEESEVEIEVGDDAEKGLAHELPTGGFKLDTRFSNELIFGSSADRARVFLKNFFPEKYEALVSSQTAKVHLENLWNLAPEWMRAHHAGPKELSLSSQRKSEKIPRDYLPDGLRDQFADGVLKFLIDWQVEQVSEEDGSSLDAAWAKLGAQVVRLQKHVEHLPALLKKLNNWEARSSKSTKGTKSDSGSSEDSDDDLLNRWLHYVALSDLLQKEYEVTITLAQAKEVDKRLAEEPFVRLAERTEGRANKIRERLDEARALRDELNGKLRSHKHRGGGGVVHETITLSREEWELVELIEELDIFQTDSNEPLTQGIREALAQGIPCRIFMRDVKSCVKLFGQESITLGKYAGSLGEMFSLVEKLQTFFSSIVKARKIFATSPREMHEYLDELEQAIVANQSEDISMIREFTQLVTGDLSDATNELMALMTPARWAYQDIEIKPEFNEEGQQLALDAGGISAAIKLNTAELNTMALSLFLLTALGRNNNPIATIVLDDPFENMDELSTVTVARAFARLHRLWKKYPALENWQLILLLHGAENFERFRDEVPCAAYFLPWLTPSDPGTDGKIPSAPSKVDDAKMLSQ